MTIAAPAEPERRPNGAFPTEIEWTRIGDRFGWSQQERLVVVLLARGLSCKRVAFLALLAVSTVHTYRRRAMRKADAHTVAELVWRIIEARDGLGGTSAHASRQCTA